MTQRKEVESPPFCSIFNIESLPRRKFRYDTPDPVTSYKVRREVLLDSELLLTRNKGVIYNVHFNPKFL